MRRFRVERSLTLEASGGSLEAWVADSFRARLLGLAGAGPLAAGRGLLIPRCAAVHTAGMRWALDVAFLAWPPGPGCEVLAVREGLGPFRLCRHGGRGGARATAVLEAPAGTLAPLGVRPGGPPLRIAGERRARAGRNAGAQC